MDLTSIHEVEDLHHHKGIEDKGEMARVSMGLIVDYRIIFASTWSVKPTTANSTPHYTVVPPVLGMGYVEALIIKDIPLLRDKGLTNEDQD